MNTVNLRVLEEYRAGATFYAAGSVISVPSETAAWLQRDAPGCFEVIVDEPAKAPEGPPADKMLRKPEVKK